MKALGRIHREDAKGERSFQKTLKFQISSIKLQINSKFQCSMTKTHAIAVSGDFLNGGIEEIIFWGIKAGRPCVSNFEFGSLGFV
jgi:hypothetical protein